MISGPVIAMELVGENSVKKWRNLIGPTVTQVDIYLLKGCQRTGT
jgi:nucleoside diphosphate kinase